MTDEGSGSEATSSPKLARAEAKAAKAHTKALRPWYKKKRYLIPLAVLVIVAVSVVAGGGSDDGEKPSDKNSGEEAANGSGDQGEPDEQEDQTDTKNLSLYPDRPDRQKEDHEARIGDAVRLSGYTATVTTATFQQSISVIEEEGYLVVDVTVENRDDEAQPYNTFDWKLQLPSGQVLDPCLCGGGEDEQLGSGDLVKGGTASGKVIFEIGQEKGDFYVIYKPDAFDAARGIWKASVA